MLTIKKRGSLLFLALLFIVGLTGCGPPGPRALHKGERLINAGDYTAAVPVLNDSLQLLHEASPVVRARAWNLLGMAYHGSGQWDSAAKAYTQALNLDRNLWAADFNLGCLRLAQSNYPAAIDLFNTYTLSHVKEAEGFLLLGRSELNFALTRSGTDRGRWLDSSRHAYETAEKWQRTAEAANALGVIELQHRSVTMDEVRTADNYFQVALQRDPKFAPAILNLGIVAGRYLNDPHQALQHYNEYVALEPAPALVMEVGRMAHQMEVDQRITIEPREAQSNSGTSAATANPATVRSSTNNQAARYASRNPANSYRPAAAPRVSQPVSNNQSAGSPPAPGARVAASASEAPVPQQTTAVDLSAPVPSDAHKRTFGQKLNPMNWFSGNIRKGNTETPLTGDDSAPLNPVAGERLMAERWTVEGRHAEHQGNHTEALRDYREAVKSDPSYFDGQLALGLAAIDAKQYSGALDALSQALSIRGNSADARYAFAWVLNRRGYSQDSANQLERLLALYPGEIRGRLLLGNIYADSLGQPKLARAEYLKALQLMGPDSAQAPPIQAWLDQHP